MPLELPELDLKISQGKNPSFTEETELYDLAIIGGGPAGMTAAVYASRKKLRTLLVTENLGGQVLWTSDIENYPGYQYITGQELSKKFSTQIAANPIDILMPDEAVKLQIEKNQLFKIMTRNKKGFTAKSLVIASGKRYRQLGIPGEKELLGKGVAYCATCDAPLFAGKDVAIAGGGNSALTAANDLLRIANKIYIINTAPVLQGDPVLIEKAKDPKVEHLLGWQTKEIKGRDKVESIIIEQLEAHNTRELKVDGIFIEVGLDPNSEFARGVLDLNERGEILVDCSSRTSVLGIFAAGDVTNVQEKQIIIAAGDGAKASLAAYRFLQGRRD
jgi:NADH-dependent peroxiredoxin subunit F